MIKIKRAVRPPVEARAVNHVRDLAIRDEVVHLRPIFRLIFEVRILNDDDVTARGDEAGLNGSPLATVALMETDPNGDVILLRRFCPAYVTSRIDLDT